MRHLAHAVALAACASAAPAVAAAQPSTTPPQPAVVVTTPPSTFYLGMGLDVGTGGELYRYDIGFDLAFRAARTPLWYRFRGSVGNAFHPDGGGYTVLQGLAGLEARAAGRRSATSGGVDLGIAKLARDAYDDFGDPVDDPEALGLVVRPRVAVDLGGGAVRFRLGVTTPIIYARDTIELSVMCGVGFIAGN